MIRTVVVCFSDWHLLLANSLTIKNILILDGRKKSFIHIVLTVRSATVLTFADKPFVVQLIKLLCKKLIFVEEGIGIYRIQPKRIKSIVAKCFSVLKTISAFLILNKHISYRYEQGRAKLCNKYIVRNKKEFSIVSGVNVSDMISFENFISFKASFEACDYIFWGCDFVSLNVHDLESSAFRNFQNMYPQAKYIPHPKTVKCDSISKIIGNAVTDNTVNLKCANVQATLCSGALVDGKFCSDKLLVFYPKSTENGLIFLNLFDTECIGDEIYIIKSCDGESIDYKTLHEAVNCALH
jgi:hypothetical protein